MVVATTEPKAPSQRGRAKKQASNYICGYCGKAFMREAAYIDHVCTQMQRHQKMKTSEGVAAWIAYSTWLKVQGKKVPPQTSFLSSHYYQSFIKFASFVQQVKTLDIEEYIRHMVKNNIQPVIWTHNAIYGEWIRANSVERSPLKAVQKSCVFLLDVAEEKNVPIEQLFENCSSPEVGNWIATGQVSPWLLLNSNSFKQWWSQLDDDDKQQLSKIISPSEWMARIKSNPTTVQKIKPMVAEMGI
jgi:hypothetical protein